MSLSEISIVINAQIDYIKQQAEIRTQQDYILASMIARFIGLSLNGKPFPSMNELFPKEDNQQQDSELEYKKAMLTKEMLIDFAHRHNKQRRQSMRKKDGE